MTPPSRSAPHGCVGDGCASGRDAWPLYHVRHEGVFCRLCSSCVLLYHPAAFCSACLYLLSPAAAAATPEPAVALPGPTTACSTCGLSVAHLSCTPGDPASFVCPPCSAAAEGMPFSFTPEPPGGGRRTLDERDARVILVAARIAHESVSQAAASAREEAERCAAEAAASRKRSREMLDAAFRALEAEARDVKMKSAPAPAPVPVSNPAAVPALPPPKKKTPKIIEANRDKLLKLNVMHQPALAFAATAAAAAAASSIPLSTPPSREEKKQVKHEAAAQGSASRDDRTPLFGTLQS